MKKALITIFFSLLLFCSPACAQSTLANGTCGLDGANNLVWKLDSYGTLTISGHGEMIDELFPEDVPWNNYRNNIKRVHIGEGTTSIGHECFKNCSRLKEITIPETVTKIGSYAFYGCTSLEAITLPKDIMIIDSGAFWGCTSLKKINLPTKLVCIHKFTFSDCISLTHIKIPEGVVYIGVGAVFFCKALLSIEFPSTIRTIDKMGFIRCDNATRQLSDHGYCGNMEYIISYAIKPPICIEEDITDAACFEQFNPSIPIYLPSTTIDLYKTNDSWQHFTTILPLESIPQ